MANEPYSNYFAFCTPPTDSSASWTCISSSMSIESGARVLVDTSNNPVTLSLPFAPVPGDTIRIRAAEDTFSQYPLILNRNSRKISARDKDVVVQTNMVGFALIYVEDEVGWQIYDEDELAKCVTEEVQLHDKDSLAAERGDYIEITLEDAPTVLEGEDLIFNICYNGTIPAGQSLCVIVETTDSGTARPNVDYTPTQETIVFDVISNCKQFIIKTTEDITYTTPDEVTVIIRVVDIDGPGFVNIPNAVGKIQQRINP